MNADAAGRACVKFGNQHLTATGRTEASNSCIASHLKHRYMIDNGQQVKRALKTCKGVVVLTAAALLVTETAPTVRLDCRSAFLIILTVIYKQ